MVWIYIGLIILSAFPLIIVIFRMRRSAHIKKNGIHVDAIVTQIKTLRSTRGAGMDLLTLEYKERATGRSYFAGATAAQRKFRIGDRLTVAYLPDKPAKHVVDLKNATVVVLIFCILLFLFVLFAVYKINEMVKSGSM